MGNRYDGLVYKDTKADLLCDLAEERVKLLDRQVGECAKKIKELAQDEIDLLKILQRKVEEVTECSVYGASDAAGLLEKSYIADNVEPAHKELLRQTIKLSVLCAKRYEMQDMLDACSMELDVLDDGDGEDD